MMLLEAVTLLMEAGRTGASVAVYVDNDDAEPVCGHPVEYRLGGGDARVVVIGRCADVGTCGGCEISLARVRRVELLDRAHCSSSRQSVGNCVRTRRRALD